MPIAILGTGRSGTSMIARMLNLSGLYLGEEEGLWDERSNPRMNPAAAGFAVTIRTPRYAGLCCSVLYTTPLLIFENQHVADLVVAFFEMIRSPHQ